MTTVNGKLNREGYDISKEDLAKELEAQADRIRQGITKAVSVTIVAKDNQDNVIVQNMFAGTNPHRDDPESGRLERAEITGLKGEELVETFNLYLNSIDMLYSDENAWSTGDDLGIGYIGGDDNRFVRFVSEGEKVG